MQRADGGTKASPSGSAPVLNGDRARAALAEHGVDVLIGASAEGSFYLTGFQSLSRWIMRGSVVPVLGLLNAEGSTTLVAPAGEIDRFAFMPVAVDRVVSFGSIAAQPGDRTAWTAADERLFELALAGGRPESFWEALDTVMVSRGRIAVDDPDLIQPLAERYGGEVIDGRPLMRHIRLIKSDEEIERLRRAVTITEQAMLASMGQVRVGMSELDLAETFNHEVLSGGGQPCLSVIAFAGYGAYGNHAPGDVRLRRGDLIRWDVGCEYEGYPADIARTGLVGIPSNAQQAEWRALLAGQLAAIAAIRPGRTASQIYGVAVSAAGEAGLIDYAPKHCGHGIGIGMYEPPLIAAGDATDLQPGMVFELELIHKVLGQGGMHVEDTIVVTDSGCETLTSVAHELFLLPG